MGTACREGGSIAGTRTTILAGCPPHPGTRPGQRVRPLQTLTVPRAGTAVAIHPDVLTDILQQG